MSGPAAATQEGPLALICGGGSLPLAVADAVTARGRKVLLFPLHGIAAPADYAGRDCTWVRIAQFGTVARRARAEGCRDIVLIGFLVRPAFRQLRFDWTTIKMLPRIAAAYRGGDNHLLTGVAKLIEQEGFRVRGAHEVAPEILVPEGVLGSIQPCEQDRADITFGLAYLHATGAFDVGQAVVVADRHVLAVEAIEGTDGMLERVAELRGNGRIRAPRGRGVLVKAPKPTQDRRLDLPSIGPKTVDGVARAGLAGIAVMAGGTVIAEPVEMAAAADKAGVFVVGVPGSTS